EADRGITFLERLFIVGEFVALLAIEVIGVMLGVGQVLHYTLWLRGLARDGLGLLFVLFAGIVGKHNRLAAAKEHLTLEHHGGASGILLLLPDNGTVACFHAGHGPIQSARIKFALANDRGSDDLVGNFLGPELLAGFQIEAGDVVFAVAGIR